MLVDCCGSGGSTTVWEQNELYKFIITVKMCYRNVPYHNFEHAFNVTHCIFCMLKLYNDKFSLNEVIIIIFQRYNKSYTYYMKISFNFI